MAFYHGKNAKFWVDGWEMTNYFNDFQMMAKAGTAETTVFGKGAKTFIGGLKEGTITGKGYFDPTATSGPDAVLSAALGRNTNAVGTFVPSALSTGSVQGTPCVTFYAALTDYNVSAPVTGVVATNFSAQADSGLSTGIILWDPTAAAATSSLTGFGKPTNLTYSAGIGTGTLTATGSTAAFPPSGALIVTPTSPTSTNAGWYLYTGISGNTFTGVTTVIAITGTPVVIAAGNLDNGTGAVSSTNGLVAVLHVLTLTGSTPTITIATLQHSADGVTWADLASFNGGGTITAVGGYNALVQAGTTTINPFLRAYVTTAATTTTTFGISAARQ